MGFLTAAVTEVMCMGIRVSGRLTVIITGRFSVMVRVNDFSNSLLREHQLKLTTIGRNPLVRNNSLIAVASLLAVIKRVAGIVITQNYYCSFPLCHGISYKKRECEHCMGHV